MGSIQLKGDEEKIKECTSIKYDGVIALLKPEESWVAKWQRLGTCHRHYRLLEVAFNLDPIMLMSLSLAHSTGKFTKGLYAVRVIGRLPPDAIEALEEKGFQYIPRDNVGGV